MPYTETHEITVGPIVLPVGVTVVVTQPPLVGGQQAVTFVGAADTNRGDVVTLLNTLFVGLSAAATADGVTP